MAEENKTKNDTLAEKKQQLEEVRMAIRNIYVGGQSYKIGSRSLTRADLATLRSIESDLEAQTNTGTPGLLDDTYVALFDRR